MTQSPVGGSAGATATPAAVDLAAVLELERLRLLAEQSAAAVSAVLVGLSLVAVVLGRYVSAAQLSLWITAFLAVNALRIIYSRRLLTRFGRSRIAGDTTVPAGLEGHSESAATSGPESNRSIRTGLQVFLAIAAFNGAWAGSMPLMFFDQLPVAEKVALTVIVLLSVSGATVTYGSFRRGLLVFLLLALPALSLAWWLDDSEHAWVLLLALLVFTGTVARQSREFDRVFVRSVGIRLEREDMVRQLRARTDEAETARQRAVEANLAKSRFLAAASHDLRQPAHALGLFTAVLARTAETPQQREIAGHLTLASRALGALLNNLLDISRLDAGAIQHEPRVTPLRPLIDKLQRECQSLIDGRSLTLTAHAPDIDVMLDPVLAERALRNLLDNALKFTASGSVHLSADVHNGRLVFTVKDTGPGIPPAIRSLVFEEFFQADNPERDHRKGLGLGLSIVDRLCRLMGGQVHLQSEIGVGSTFTIDLPWHAVPASKAHGHSPPLLGSSSASHDTAAVSMDLTGMRILVIDDEPMARTGIAALLRHWGATVDEVDGLGEAMSLTRSHPPDGVHWDVVLCDLRLRGDESGLATGRTLQAMQPGLSLVIVTGETGSARVQEALNAGADVLHKPVTDDELATCMSVQLARRRTA